MQKHNIGIDCPIVEWRIPEHATGQHTKSHQAKPQPYSIQFQDVYYSSDNGLLETDYVFLQGNRLASRWEILQHTDFTIIETGFGTGLNFLCAAQLWLQCAPKDAVLHFISTEKYTLSLQEITLALQCWPELSLLSTPFLTQYEALKTEYSVLLFDDRVRLTLLIGDAAESFTKIDTTADAWFLDGFSPAKNPEMWQATLFSQMARLSKNDTTFATFTSAGNVRRGMQSAGFVVEKRPGFGKKREMLTGRFIGNEVSNQNAAKHYSER